MGTDRAKQSAQQPPAGGCRVPGSHPRSTAPTPRPGAYLRTGVQRQPPPSARGQTPCSAKLQGRSEGRKLGRGRVAPVRAGRPRRRGSKESAGTGPRERPRRAPARARGRERTQRRPPFPLPARLTRPGAAGPAAAASSSAASSSSLDKMAAAGSAGRLGPPPARPRPSARPSAPQRHPRPPPVGRPGPGSGGATHGAARRVARPPRSQRRGWSRPSEARGRWTPAGPSPRRPAAPPPRRADGVGAGAAAPSRSAGDADRPARPAGRPAPPAAPKGTGPLPETLGRTPPPPAARRRRPLRLGLPARRRDPPAAPALRRSPRPRSPAGTAGGRRRSHSSGSSAAGGQNKQPCRRRRRRRRQRTYVTAHAARAAPQPRSPTAARRWRDLECRRR